MARHLASIQHAVQMEGASHWRPQRQVAAEVRNVSLFLTQTSQIIDIPCRSLLHSSRRKLPPDDTLAQPPDDTSVATGKKGVPYTSRVPSPGYDSHPHVMSFWRSSTQSTQYTADLDEAAVLKLAVAALLEVVDPRAPRPWRCASYGWGARSKKEMLPEAAIEAVFAELTAETTTTATATAAATSAE